MLVCFGSGFTVSPSFSWKWQMMLWVLVLVICQHWITVLQLVKVMSLPITHGNNLTVNASTSRQKAYGRVNLLMLITVSRRQFAWCVSVGSGSISAKKKKPQRNPIPFRLQSYHLGHAYYSDCSRNYSPSGLLVCLLEFPLAWNTHTHTYTHIHFQGKKKLPMKGEDHKGRWCHGGFLFFTPIKINLSVWGCW